MKEQVNGCPDCSNFGDCPLHNIIRNNGGQLTAQAITTFILQDIQNESTFQRTHTSPDGRKRTTFLSVLTKGAAAVTCINKSSQTIVSNFRLESQNPEAGNAATETRELTRSTQLRTSFLTAAGNVIYTEGAERENNININTLEINVAEEGQSKGEFNIANISDIHLAPTWLAPFGLTTILNLRNKLNAVRQGLENQGANTGNTLLVEGGDLVTRDIVRGFIPGRFRSHPIARIFSKFVNTETPMEIFQKGIDVWNEIFGNYQMIKVTGNADVQHSKSKEIFEKIQNPHTGMRGMIEGFAEPWNLDPDNMILDVQDTPISIIRTHDYFHQPQLVEKTPQIVAELIRNASNKGKKVVVVDSHFALYMEELEKYDLPEDMTIIMTSGHTHDANYNEKFLGGFPRKKNRQQLIQGRPEYPWVYGCYQTKKGNIVTVSGGLGSTPQTPWRNSRQSVDMIKIKY